MTFNTNLFSLAFLSQLVIFAVAIGLGWLIKLFLWRPFEALKKRLRTPLAGQVLVILDKLLWPLIVGGLNWLTVRLIMQPLGWPHDFLAHSAVLIIGLWLGYQFIHACLELNLSPAAARVWSRQILLPLILLFVFLSTVGLQERVLNFRLTPPSFEQDVSVGSLFLGLGVMVIFFFLARLAWQFMEDIFLPQAEASPALTHAISTLIGYTIIFIGALLGLSVIGLDFATLTVIAGGLSIGLGFGLQQIVSNFVSGFIIMFEQSIGPGDVINLGGKVGVVHTIGVRRTVVRTAENQEVTIPNSLFLSDIVTNLSRDTPLTQLHVKVGVSYQSNPREVEQVLLEAAQHPSILHDPQPTVEFADFGKSLVFILAAWTNDPTRLGEIASDVRYRIWDGMKQRQIQITVG